MRAMVVGLLVVPMLVAADATTPPAGWKEYSPKDKSFAVWLPEKAGRRSERERTMSVRGQRIKVNLVQVEARGGLTYGASTLVLSARLVRAIPHQQRIEILRDAFLSEVKGKVSEETDIKEGLATGKEYTITTGRGAARLRVFARGGRLYRASVAGSQAQVASKDADTFLGSFKLSAKKPEAPAVTPPDKANDKAEKETADAGSLKWMADASKMKIPDAAVAGKLLGAGFTVDKAKLDGNLVLENGQSDAKIMIFLFTPKEKIEGKTYKLNIKGVRGETRPHIHIHSKSGAAVYSNGYSMLLEFGKGKEGKVAGKIYLCLPDKDKSVIAGTFTAKQE
jgi:hypothetical protein